MKTDKNDRTDEQKSSAKQCLEKLKEKIDENENGLSDKVEKLKDRREEKREQLKEKFQDSMFAEKIAEKCENTEVTETNDFCNCVEVLKVNAEDRSDEQKAVARECWRKWKENRESKPLDKLKDKIKENKKEQLKEKVQEKIEEVKNQVKQCREIRKALKNESATIQQKIFHVKNCRRNVFKKQQNRRKSIFG